MTDKLKWKLIMFDLDGTLLPMDQDTFLKCYMGMLAKYAAPYGYEPQVLIKSLWDGTGDMIRNDGSCLNYDRFWAAFARTYGEEALKDIPLFDRFYTEQFDNAKVSCGFNPMAATVVGRLKSLGYRLVLATNPVFPHMATHRRIKWAGLDKSDFEYITTYASFSRLR